MDKGIFTKGIGRCKFKTKEVRVKNELQRVPVTCGKSYFKERVLFCAYGDSRPISQLRRCPKSTLKARGEDGPSEDKQLDAFKDMEEK
jgi:hypothetical protein